MDDSKYRNRYDGIDINEKNEELQLKNRIATEQDAPKIVDLYNQIYKNNYPYRSWTDEENIKTIINNPNVIWKVFEDQFGNIAATQVLELDPDTNIAMLHGYIVDRKYQGKGIGKIMIHENCKLYLEDPNNNIEMCWCEARTSHNKSQKISMEINFFPVAFLPYKDTFFGRKESDLIMAWYNPNRGILENRRTDVKIVHEVLPFYNFVSSCLYKPLNEPMVEIWDEYDLDFSNNVSVSVEKMKYNYLKVNLKVDEDNQMEFKINSEVKSAEEFTYKFTDIKAFNSMLYMLEKIFNDQLDYIEIWVSAYDPNEQKSCLALGFVPAGYFPAIRKNTDGLNEDRIVFVKAKSYPLEISKEYNLQLTGKTATIFKIFREVLNSKIM